jgi:hypothetical protein
MKKETRFCDVCGDEVPYDHWAVDPPFQTFKTPFSEDFGYIPPPTGDTRPLRLFLKLVLGGPRQHQVDLCDRDRLRVLEAAVEQMKVTS